MSGCKAIRCNDEMHCGACGLAWDINDPEPPGCSAGGPGGTKTGERHLRLKTPIFSETEAAEIRARNARRETAETKRLREVRRRLEIMREAKEIGVDFRELL